MLVDAIVWTSALIATRHVRARLARMRELAEAAGQVYVPPVPQQDAPQGKIVAAEIKDGALVVSVEEE